MQQAGRLRRPVRRSCSDSGRPERRRDRRPLLLRHGVRPGHRRGELPPSGVDPRGQGLRPSGCATTWSWPPASRPMALSIPSPWCSEARRRRAATHRPTRRRTCSTRSWPRSSRCRAIGTIATTFCHGDLTLENMVIDRDGRIWLIDLLDSPLEHHWQDVAKLHQDLTGGWYLRRVAPIARSALDFVSGAVLGDHAGGRPPLRPRPTTRCSCPRSSAYFRTLRLTETAR